MSRFRVTEKRLLEAMPGDLVSIPNDTSVGTIIDNASGEETFSVFEVMSIAKINAELRNVLGVGRPLEANRGDLSFRVVQRVPDPVKTEVFVNYYEDPKGRYIGEEHDSFETAQNHDYAAFNLKATFHITRLDGEIVAVSLAKETT